jgi:hypothetical protein
MTESEERMAGDFLLGEAGFRATGQGWRKKESSWTDHLRGLSSLPRREQSFLIKASRTLFHLTPDFKLIIPRGRDKEGREGFIKFIVY